MLTTHPPEGLGLHPRRFQEALNLLHRWCDEDRIPAAGLVVARQGRTTGTHVAGRQTVAPRGAAIRNDAIFLIASITKPIVGLGVLMLVERGLIALDDRVEEYLPGFGREGKHAITLRHLLTHTSGLPDMLPNNAELRAAHAPLAKFVEEIGALTPSFPAGRGVQYQSTGFALLGEVIARVTGTPAARFLKEELFEPLDMHDTALGAPDDWFDGAQPKIARVAEIRLTDEQRDTNYHWNTRYWRQFGAPWGGLLTTPMDLALLGQMLLTGGRVGGDRLLSPATIQAATTNQLAAMPEVPEVERRCRPWGLGWRLNWPGHSANFGDLLGPRTFGHWGATGTLMWIDPDREMSCTILTTQPQEPRGQLLARLSNAVAAAVE
jgi:CubicO group peptidase (beta-lactamase class C family)